MLRDGLLLVDDEHPRFGAPGQDLARDSEPDDAGADDRDVIALRSHGHLLSYAVPAAAWPGAARGMVMVSA